MSEHNLAQYALVASFADVSTAEIKFIAVPFAGNLVGVQTCIEGAITGADADVVVDAGSVEVGTITIANSGSAAGTVDSLVCSSYVGVGDFIKLDSDGASTGAQSMQVTVVIDRRY